ncbi:MAG TPA: tetratricopeptide repeat protein [Ramlibacter sp.]|jgi:type III secretion system low calcium response chaperone LcrH/SycD|uniref:tetratricopeptide repeat protein n=1 Tax=Ramlibacter sp. TaxID=1917967 RepID=UPI002D42AEEE|nr:tetratricopeptide repeat protein [Ramlibacter sp.]HZY20508.1 tetratricopeptide repeat protein [Ramlibacter sp.]
MTQAKNQPAVAAVLELKDALEALPGSARLSNADVEAVYALAHQLVAQARYETAFRYFSLLTLYRPTEVRYLRGLALCHRMLERYGEAMNVYAFLATIEPHEPQHSLDIAECLLLQRDLEEARRTVELVIRYCQQGAAGGERVRKRAEALAGLMAAKGEATA